MKNTLSARLVDCAREASAALHGAKRPVYERYCAEFGWLKADGSANVQHLLRKLAKAGLCAGRAQRSDKGLHLLPQIEAEEIVRWQRENARANGKNLVCVEDAVAVLREAAHIKAEYLDEDTGEIKPLSIGAIRAAIRHYGLSASVLNTPPPAMRMRTLHANHVWEIDASLCVLYYLPADGGLQVMREMLFNSNKPKNIKRIENERVWRYLVVDHASGCIYVEYVFGGESGANLTQIFINAMQSRPNEFWGVPLRVYVDAGAANTGAVFKGLCQQLEIDVQWHLPGNARATGSVEKSQDIVERKFESMLAARPVFNLTELNLRALHWRIKFNQHAVHSRHGLPRFAAWQKHIASHLVAPPSVEVCRALASTTPKQRQITQYLTVDFEGQSWDASAYPGVYRGLKVQVCRDPWSDDNIRIIEPQADGAVKFHLAALKQTNNLGYWESSPVLGEQFKRHAMTPPEHTLARLAERTAADQEQAGAQAAVQTTEHKLVKPMPFGGKVDPFKPLEVASASAPTYLPRKADEQRAVNYTASDSPPLTHTQAAITLRGLLGRNLSEPEFTWIATRFADGVPAEQIEALAAQFTAGGAESEVKPETFQPLRAVS